MALMYATEAFAKLNLCPCWFLERAIEIMRNNYNYEIAYKVVQLWERDNDKHKDKI